MTNYYEILGLSPGAGIIEIKSAFRQLAKLYHPDKNPDGKEYFEKVLKAYETLSDPIKKTSYDYKLNYHQSQPNPTVASTKNWRFDERELKRRKYYNEHIKRYSKSASYSRSQSETEKTYNEFKYILFATPLAVILFILIMKLATSDSPVALPYKHAIEKGTVPGLSMGDAPYTGFFGSPVYDTIEDRQLTVKNETGVDVVVCLFTRIEFVRSLYIQRNKLAAVTDLPDQSLEIRYSSGVDFDRRLKLTQAGVFGGFSKNKNFYHRMKPLPMNAVNELILRPGVSKDFVAVEEENFFKKKDKHDKKN